MLPPSPRGSGVFLEILEHVRISTLDFKNGLARNAFTRHFQLVEGPMISNEPEKKAAPDFRVDVKLRDVLVNSSEIRNRSESALAVEEGLPEPVYPQFPYPRW